jgi:hypothetical protein
MRRFSWSESTDVYFDSIDLTLNDDGTFRWSVGFSDPAGWAGGYGSTGRWRRHDDTIDFEILKYDSDPPGNKHPSTATFVGDRLEVDGVGSFGEIKKT